MKAKFFVALVAAVALLGGCDKKDGAADKGGDKKEAKGDDGDLPKVCQDYFKAWDACSKNMPAAAKPAMEQGITQMKDAMKKAGSAEAKKAMEPGCKAGLDALKGNPACK